jgi:hypothetical protein
LHRQKAESKVQPLLDLEEEVPLVSGLELSLHLVSGLAEHSWLAKE